MSLRKLHKGDYFQALLFVIALSYGIYSVEVGKSTREEQIHKDRVSTCQTMRNKYKEKYSGSYTIINSILYCENPTTEGYDKYPVETTITYF